MEAMQGGESCEFCGQLIDSGHGHEVGADSAAEQGERVEYVIVEIRGALALYQAADGSSRVLKTTAATLAQQLGVAPQELLGLHYTCLVTPAEYGEIRSEFRVA